MPTGPILTEPLHARLSLNSANCGMQVCGTFLKSWEARARLTPGRTGDWQGPTGSILRRKVIMSWEICCLMH